MKRFEENKFILMNKDTGILNFEISYDSYGTFVFEEKESLSSIRPYGYENINQWLQERQAPKHREHIEQLLKSCGCYDLDGYIRVTHALTLNDTFWVKEQNSPLKWEQVSLYQNEFNEVIAKIAFEGGLYGERFSSTSPEFGTDGTYPKCWIRKEGKIYLMKGGSSGARNAGKEPYSEYYASQIAQKICKNNVTYTLENFRRRLASKCELFTNEKEGFISASKLMPKYFSVVQLMNLYEKYDSGEDFKRMIVFDAITVNVDRHMGNHGFIIDNDSMEIKKMAPIFDNNLSLLPYAEEEDFLNINKYLYEQKPKIGSEFCDVAHRMLTSSIRADLINLKDFRFETSGNINLSAERINELNNVVQKQIRGVLDCKQYYIEVIKPFKEQEEKEMQAIFTDDSKSMDFFLKTNYPNIETGLDNDIDI